jgi:sugar phosphate isomerase/epimerase
MAIHAAMTWLGNYTIPGHGVSDWKPILNILAENGYHGCISIELEDHFYDDTEAEQKQGVLRGVKFLAGS